ncbi:hypothetical protein J4470_01600 [Candidatus Woesearchaeota archaeon]|nr:hypothetical protein [Candidatus Woesearchaeota archaeon]
MTGIAQIISELDSLPLKSADERHEEYMLTGDLTKLNNHRLTATPKRIIESSGSLSGEQFSAFLQHAISMFPNPQLPSGITGYAFDTFYGRSVLCTVAVEAFLSRDNRSEADRLTLRNALAQVKGYEMEILVFDKFDESGVADAEITIDKLLMRLSELPVP